ncbi:MAG: formyl transferase [Alphaproteobacteria bacterium]|nr:formyl transferase [Alphaproteobacteria bacterium]
MHTLNKNIVMLGSDNPTTWIVYNHLVREFGLFPIFIEKPLSRIRLLKNRIKKLGVLAVIDQLAFIFAVRPLIQRRYNARIKNICHTNGLEVVEPLSTSIFKIESVNGEDFRRQLTNLQPDIIIVNGTRIISKKTLAASSATIINTHQGITPAYRGAHGAYWALFHNDKTQCGVTVHLVDEGIDTGNIIAQAAVETSNADSFTTYPLLQTAAALPILTKAIKDAAAGTLVTRQVTGPSAVWYHPGITQYIAGLLRGVK